MQKALIKSQLQQFLKNNIGPSGRGFTTLELKRAINMLFATKAKDKYDDQMNDFIYPLAAANGVNLYKSYK